MPSRVSRCAGGTVKRVAEFAVFDIDGVLADVRHRLHHIRNRPKNWDAFFAAAPEDPTLFPGVDLIHAAIDSGLTVVYSTGRPQRCRADTIEWFERHGLPRGELFMRRDSDRRPARMVKLGVAENLLRRGEIAYAVDDHFSVVQELRSAGLDVIHATWMSDDSPSGPQQGELFDAQEHGLT